MRSGSTNSGWRDGLAGELRGGEGVCTALVVAVLLGVALWGWSQRSAQDAAPRPGIVVLQPSPPTGASVPTDVLVAREETARCPQQSMLLFGAGGPPTPACVQPARVVQDGGLRRYLFEPAGAAGWRLRLETSGGEVMAAQVTSPQGETYACVDAECDRFVLGPRGAHGREIRALDARVEGTAATAAEAPPWLSLRATLLVADDAADALRTCPGARLSMLDDRGAREPLCPEAGSGVERLAGGRLRYTYADFDGRELAVTLSADGRVDQVTLQGLRCEGVACSGVAVSLPDPADAVGAQAADGPRALLFSNARLTAGLGSQLRTVTLSGSVALPS